MEWESYSTYNLQQQLLGVEQQISTLRSAELDLLEELDRRQVHTGDGCKTMGDWLAMATDISLESARELVRTMRRTTDRPHLREALSDGVSFDRVSAVSKITTDEVGLGWEWDVAGIHREAARRARLGAEDETRTSRDQFLVVQPSLDESWWKLWGGLDGYAGAIFDKTISELADQVDVPHGVHVDAGWRRAIALIQLCMGEQAPRSEVAVFVDAKTAAETQGEAGVNVHGGAIALGRPIGATGARIVVTLLHEMARSQSRLGLATLCVSGGMGTSLLLERAAA